MLLSTFKNIIINYSNKLDLSPTTYPTNNKLYSNCFKQKYSYVKYITYITYM